MHQIRRMKVASVGQYPWCFHQLRVAAIVCPHASDSANSPPNRYRWTAHAVRQPGTVWSRGGRGWAPSIEPATLRIVQLRERTSLGRSGRAYVYCAVIEYFVKFKNGGQASQNRIAREAPHPSLWQAGSLHYPGTPLPNRSRRACPGGSPVCRLTHRQFVGKPASALGQAQRRTIFSYACVVQKLAPTGTRPVEATPFLKGTPNSKLDKPLDIRAANVAKATNGSLDS